MHNNWKTCWVSELFKYKQKQTLQDTSLLDQLELTGMQKHVSA